MRRCTVCTHPEVAKINEMLVAGTSYRDVAGRFNLSKSAVERHAKKHLPGTLVKAKEASEVADADDLLSQVCNLRDRTLAILSEAETAGKLPVALRAIQVAQGNIELLARLLIEVERHRLAEAKRKPSAEEKRLRNMSDEELMRRYFVLCDTRRIAIDVQLEAETSENQRRMLVSERDKLTRNVESMRTSIARNLVKKGGEDHG